MEIDFNRTSLLEELKKRKNWDINWFTFFSWEKKGLITPSSRMANGKRLVPVYYGKDIDTFIEKLESLQLEGRIRIKVLT